jgi:hypothetical protein
MRRFVLLMAVSWALLGGCASKPLDQSKLVGHWVGPGTFNEGDARRTVGALSFDLQFNADGSATGQVGGGSLKDGRFNGHEFRAILVGQVHTSITKDHLILLINPPDQDTMEAGFQLKSNYTADVGMLTGQAKLTRVK